MAQENYNNGLATAGLEGKSIVRCDNQKCLILRLWQRLMMFSAH